MSIFKQAREQLLALGETLFQIEAQATGKRGNDKTIKERIAGMLLPLGGWLSLNERIFKEKYARYIDGRSELETVEQVAERLAEDFAKRRPT